MPSLKSNGFDELVNRLRTLGDKTVGISKKCVYAGGRVLADAMVGAVKTLPVDNRYYPAPGRPLQVISSRDREDLAGCVGISRIESDGMNTSVSVSFDGYITRTEEGFPDGVPAVMIARSIESGSSVRAKHPFVRPALKGIDGNVGQAMQIMLDESVQQIIKITGG
jgi:hypothetical protein